MENLKIFVKDVLHKFSSKPELHHPSVRMSEIINSSNLQMSPPLQTSTLNAEGNHVMCSKIEIEIETVDLNDKTMNNHRTESMTESNIMKINNHHNLIKHENCDKSIKIDGENTLLKLQIIMPNSDDSTVINVVNDISKIQSPIQEKNSSDFIITMKANEIPSPNKTPSRPMMGKSALLKKAKIDATDSRIIHDIVTDKYNGVLNHYFNRMYQRRQSKVDSLEDDSSDTVFSSPPNYSPSTVSSISTNSMAPDEKTGFTFPFYAEISREIGHSFIESTDDNNAETTVEESGHISVTSTDTNNEKSVTSYSDYDPKKFLDNALGEAFHFSSESGISNDSLVKHKTDFQHLDEHSIGTSELSALISKASSLYTSTKKNTAKHDSKSSLAEYDNYETYNEIPHSDNAKTDNLMKELSKQNEIIFQISKALNYCKATKEFTSSIEHLEAEKILLIALCTKQAIMKEIQNSDDDEVKGNINNYVNLGRIELSNIILSLDKYIATINSQRDFIEYFLVIFTCANQVFASDIVEADENEDIKIQKAFTFPKLTAPFEIEMSIYSMKVAKRNIQNQNQKNCPSPKKMFFHLNKGQKKHKILGDVLHLKPSAFILCGNCDISKADLPRLKSEEQPDLTLKLKKLPSSCSLSDLFTITIKSEVVLNNKFNGFLTIGIDNENGCTIWNRRWCLLEEYIFKYWNYPSEEVRTPLGNIDLTNCVEQQISSADRSICARSRTVLLPIQTKETIKNYLLSADNVSELKQWESEINYVLRSLTTWNCMTFNLKTI